MTDSELSALILDQDSFFTAIRRDSVMEALKGRFQLGKKPYLHALTLEDGSKIVLKFVDTVKYLLDHKMKRIHGKDSLLSYLEVAAHPVGQKAYSRSFDIKQVVIGVPRETAEAKHTTQLEKLRALAEGYGIDLATPDAWFRIYTENYKS